MSGRDLPTLRRASATDWHLVRQLLVDAGLPVEDLAPAMLGEFQLAEADDSLVGVVGLQRFDDIGLLRSLVVANDARRKGLGGKLLAAAEAAAQSASIKELWLLTIDANAFFARHGFEISPRERAPACIRQTAEFSELCPGDAFLMSKLLR